MRQEFKQRMGEAASFAQEEEPPESEGTDVWSVSPTRIVHSHGQHLADYISIGLEEGEMLNLCEDRAAPLITEVHFFSFQVSYGHFCSNVSLLSHIFHHLIFQVLQKIWLASHIRRMADLLHADAIQQLQEAFLGSPAANMVYLHSSGWEQTRPVLMTTQPITKHTPPPLQHLPQQWSPCSAFPVR